MARQINRLNARRVATETKVGRHADGGGLYLNISDNGGRRWVFLYRREGKLREMGLGSARDVPLARARELASEARQQVAEGKDPIAARHQERDSLTFATCAKRLIEAKRPGWRNAKHADQWTRTLETYVFPVMGDLPVEGVTVAHVMKVLEAIWASKTETASRVRSRIENVLDWAKAHGHRTGENPARWRGHLQNLLPKRSSVQQVQHHPALPYDEVATFMAALRDRHATAADCLEFVILTGARTSEATGAKWDEIDLDRKIWTVPGDRMKGRAAHRVPLSSAAMNVLRRRQRQAGEDKLVFANSETGEELSENAMLALLERMGYGHVTVHGFRSTFRDWAEECTNFTRETSEKALAHKIKDKAEAAYRRGDLLDKRRALMEAWATYCSERKAASKVLPLRKTTAQSAS